MAKNDELKTGVVHVDSTDWLGCPFCGNTQQCFWMDDDGYVFVQCHEHNGCGARGPKCGSMEEAETLWLERHHNRDIDGKSPSMT